MARKALLDGVMIQRTEAQSLSDGY
jgi:hypothetical protein